MQIGWASSAYNESLVAPAVSTDMPKLCYKTTCRVSREDQLPHLYSLPGVGATPVVTTPQSTRHLIQKMCKQTAGMVAFQRISHAGMMTKHHAPFWEAYLVSL